ncbi:MAG: hypothetical protein Q8L68_04680 [Methylococcales bacterium]|nr:hypothetical protein [Methylococcales bacterium]
MNRWYGAIKIGKIVFPTQTRQMLDEFVATKFKEDETVVILVMKQDSNITLEQYRYLYACVYEPLAAELGYTVDEIDEILKLKFLTKFKGTSHEFVTGKSELRREEMAAYIDNCIRFAAEAGIVCQSPTNIK